MLIHIYDAKTHYSSYASANFMTLTLVDSIDWNDVLSIHTAD